jgi:hypothetical protein
MSQRETWHRCRSKRGCAGGRDHCDPSANQFGGQHRQLIVAAPRPTILEGNVFPLGVTGFAWTVVETGKIVRHAVGRSAVEKSDHRHRRLLRTRRQRHARRANDYSTRSSAVASRVGGTVMPIAFAVFRLMTSSNLFGCSTGKSPGLSPLSILSTTPAARRHKSLLSGP